MARILFTWEAGGGLGHTLVHRSLVGKLIEGGHEVGFAFRDLSRAEEALGGLGVKFHQAPTYLGRPHDPVAEPCTYAHILHSIGFATCQELSALVAAWRNLFELIKPDMVIADHSPAALVALRRSSIKRVVIGTGFCCPPVRTPFPNLRNWKDVSPAELERDERRTLAVVNSVLQELGDGLDGLSDLFRDVDETFLATYPQLDHYRDRSGGNYWGTPPPPAGATPNWPEGDRRKVFAYLKPFKALPDLLHLLGELKLPTIVCSDGIPANVVARFQSETMRIESEPVDVSAAAAQCYLAVVNASHATTASLLLHGKPVLMFPRTLEQELTARAVTSFGAGLSAAPNQPRQAYEQLAHLLNRPNHAEAAKAFAAGQRDLSPDSFADRVAARIEEILMSKP